MSREIIFEAMNGVRDEYITEVGARLGLMAAGAAAVGAVGAAADGAADGAGLYSLSSAGTAAKAGFGAWLAKGGWIALAAGVLVAAGVAVGAFMMGSNGFEWPSLPHETETEETAQDGTEAETEAPDLSYFQFPLTSADDTTSYVSITSPYGDGRKTVEFFIQSQDEKEPELKSVLKFIAPQYGEANIQIVSYKTETDYGFIYVYERVITGDPALRPGEITVMMEGYRLRFDQKGRYFFKPEYGSRTCHIQGNEDRTVPITQYKYNSSLLNRAEDLLADYANLEGCELTVLYRYVDGVETVNTPVDTMPDFPFTIFNSYNRPEE